MTGASTPGSGAFVSGAVGMTSSLSVSVVVTVVVIVVVLVELVASTVSLSLAATFVTVAFSNAGDSTRLTSMSLAAVTRR